MKKRIIIIITILIVLSLGVTYAIFKWTSSNSDVTFNVEGCYITYDAGSNISGASFGPALSKDDTTNVISKEITMTPECSGVTANLTLTVDSIDDGLKEESFIYELYSGSNKVSSGNFKEATSGKVYTILNTKILTEKVTDAYTLYIYIDGNMDNPTTMGGKSFSFTLGASGENAILNPFPANAVTLVNSLDDGTTGDSGSGVYKIEHDAIPSSDSATGSEIPAVTDYRYYGSSPNNYICLDNTSDSCEDRHLYRIIGSIYEENAGQNLLKVIKATPLTDGTTNEFSWNIKSDGTYNSVWSTTTSGTSSGSTLMQLLNGIWLTRENGIYYQQNDKTIKVNFTNYGPSDYAQSLINTTSRYYLGGYDFYELKTSKTYLAERGTATSSGNANYWDGKIALTYVSDYGYAAGNTCVTEEYPVYYNRKCDYKDWLQMNKQHWTITPSSDIAIYNGGSSDYPAYASYLQCNPTFYLSKDVIITGGTGTQTDPYIASK